MRLSLRTRRAATLALALLLFAPTLGGCFYSRELAQTRRALERSSPGTDIDTEFAFTAGPNTLRFAEWVLSVTETDDQEERDDIDRAREYLRQVRRVRVGIYHIDRFGSRPAPFEPEALDRFGKRGWELALSAEEDGERAWVLYREAWGRISDMFVLIQDDRDLVMVRIDGRLDDLLRLALEDYGEFDTLIDFDFGG